jgi:hypothetical protein
VKDSFAIQAGASVGTDKQMHVAIARSSLEKEFLLQGSRIPQVLAATGSALKSRIVAFRERGGRIHMLEATQGHEVTTDLPANILLASFPIVKEDKDQIVFDFNAGMSALYTLGDLTGADINDGVYNPNNMFTAAGFTRAFIDAAKVDVAKNRLYIRQVVQVNLRGTLLPYEVQYYLSPYRPSADFVGHRGSKDYDRYGFFQTEPFLTNQSDTIMYDTRWNTKKPVVYAISANTPAEFKQAVREGVLYWNIVAGREIVQVIDAPKGMTAPNPDYNIVQWVPYDTAGFAYADIQADPRTGEILHAQVFMTSVFATLGKARARAIMRKLSGEKSAPVPAKLQVRGLEQEPLCDYDPTREITGMLADIVEPSLDDKAAQKVAIDYIRQVVAHEIGHTLGLRHNFAGSLASTIATADRPQVFQKYLDEGKATTDAVFSSSVMEYTLPEESAMMGDQMKSQAFDYDKMAIATLYDDAKYKDSEWPLFCTDTSMGAFIDCAVFDTSKSVIEYNAWTEQNNNKMLPNTLLELYINGQTPLANGFVTPAEKVMLPDPETYAKQVLIWREILILEMSKSGQILSVDRQYPISAEFNANVILDAQTAYLKSEVARLGGFNAIFQPLPADFVAQSNAKIARLLDSNYSSGYSRQDKKFAFTDADKATIKANADIFFKRYAEEYHKMEINILAGADLDGQGEYKLRKSDLADQLATYLANREEQIVLGQSGNYIEGDVEVPDPAAKPGSQKTIIRHVRLPVYTETFENRLAAASLLSASRSEDVDWAFLERATVKDDFTKEFDKNFNTDLSKAKTSKFPKEIARWVLENQKIQGAL